MFYLRGVATGAFLISLLAGCGAQNNPLQTASLLALKAGASTRTPLLSGTGRLYVASTGIPGSVLVFKTPAFKLVRTITQNVNTPVGLELGPGDRLYVGSNSHNYNAVNEYSRNGRTFLKTISHLRGPEQIAFDSQGNIYVRRYNAVNIYSASNPRSMREIKVNSDFIALDASNNLYAATRYQNAVNVYAPGSKTPTRTITDGITEAQGLAFDTSGNLYVANSGSTTGEGCGTDPGSVQIYAPGASSPMYNISGAQGICQPFRLTFDATGNLYVANISRLDGGPPSTVTVYAPGGNTLLRTITDGVSSPWSLALDKAGFLYVANRFIGTITVYSPGSTELVQTLSNIPSPEALVVGK
jgi:sugar lactone lactonase YvrE